MPTGRAGIGGNRHHVGLEQCAGLADDDWRAIDMPESPTQVNKLAKEHDIEWFERNVVVDVPPPYPGAFRKVYPGLCS